jgi:hypothetical protein
MVGRHNRARRQGSTFDRATLLGVALTLLVAVIFVVLGVFVRHRQAEVATLNPSTFCPNSGPIAVHAILIDRTDPLTDLQLDALQQHILQWAEQVPQYAALRIYEVGVGGALLHPVVDVCNPGDGSGASNFTSNPAFLKRRYHALFLQPVQSVLASMRADKEQAKSPILEAVQAISVRDFGDTGAKGDNALIIVSDLLEYDGELNFYRTVPSADSFAKSPAGRSLHADFSNVTATIFLLNRQKDAKFQTDALGEFWMQWLTLQGADVDGFKQFPG